MKQRCLMVLLVMTMMAAFPVFAEETGELLPVDKNVKIGKLDNGLTYYIRKNLKPEKRLALNLVVKAGAVDEDENQRGLAHLCEHMAFNGTKHFEKNELVNYLESIGMRFGAELNAYTSFDETVYMLNIPTENDSVLGKGFQVLDDWASNVSYEDEEIDKERKVVHEEWRSGRGANQRILDDVLPVVFYDSKYAERLPIGLMDVVDNCKYETLRKFYRDWYRPDLMAVVAVGDYDVEKTEELIEKYFSDNRNPKKAREKKRFSMPGHKETKYIVSKDEELTMSGISIYIKHEPKTEKTRDDYRRRVVKSLFNQMLNQRYAELTQKADPPFLGAFAAESKFVFSKDFYMIGATTRDERIGLGLKTLLTEIKRVNEHGFLNSELERAKLNHLSRLKSAFKEREKTNSQYYVREYSNHFLYGTPIPGVAWEYETAKTLLEEINVEEVNGMASEMITEENRVVTAYYTDKEGGKGISEEELKKITDEVKNMDTEPYEESFSKEPLVKDNLKPGAIKDSVYYEDLGIKKIVLSNGVELYYKSTDFKDDEIILKSYSKGGTSLSSDEDYVAVSIGAELANMSGVGDFDNVALEKKLAGKNVSVKAYLGELNEGINGRCSKDDLETLFKLVYLYFKAPRKDDEAYQALLTKKKTYVKNRSSDPRSAFSDTLGVVMNNHHFRSRPMTLKVLEEMDMDKAFDFYRERFSDGNDFIFFMIGSMDENRLKEYALKYLANLPVTDEEETWKDVNREYPEGLVEKEIKAGMDDKGTVALVYNKHIDWSWDKAVKLDVTGDILNIMLREKIREDEGGTYGVRVYGSAVKEPKESSRFMIFFNCDPRRAEELVSLIKEEVEKLKTEGPSDVNMEKVKSIFKKSREKDLKNNRFWIDRMIYCHRYGLDFSRIFEDEKMVSGLTKDDIKKAANLFFGDNLIKIIHYPTE